MLKTEGDVLAQAKELFDLRMAEKQHLDRIYDYWKGKQPVPAVPRGVPQEMVTLAKISRINLIRLAVEIPAQSMFVVGYRTSKADEDEAVWEVLQRNRIDRLQLGVHRSGLAYGASYVRGLPGKDRDGTEIPVFAGVSPRNMTAAYERGEEFPTFALEKLDRKGTFRFYDDTSVWKLAYLQGEEQPWRVLEGAAPHGWAVVPVARFQNRDDLEDETEGEIEPLMNLQDQIDVTTFEMLVAQHFQAWRLRYILGWTAKDEAQLARVSAGRMLTLDVDPKEVTVGEFAAGSTAGYLESRSSTVEMFATISQTPPHHLLGKLVNLSAEALAAAESGHQRKVEDRETTFGGTWEDVAWLGATWRNSGIEIDPEAQIQWKDTEARALAATVDALGKMAQMLGIPVEVLWSRIPGFTQQDVKEAKEIAARGGALDRLAEDTERQLAELGGMPTDAGGAPRPSARELLVAGNGSGG